MVSHLVEFLFWQCYMHSELYYVGCRLTSQHVLASETGVFSAFPEMCHCSGVQYSTVSHVWWPLLTLTSESTISTLISALSKKILALVNGTGITKIATVVPNGVPSVTLSERIVFNFYLNMFTATIMHNWWQIVLRGGPIKGWMRLISNFSAAD